MSDNGTSTRGISFDPNDGGSSSKRIVSFIAQHWSLGLLAVIVVLPFVLYVSGNPLALASTFHDDAYYYFKIAENIVTGRGSTFDGEAMTNGYQPLWQYALLPFAYVAAHINSPEIKTLWYGLVVGLSYLFLGFLLWRHIYHWYGHMAAQLSVVMFAYARVTTLFTGGMESVLLGLLLIVFIDQAMEQFARERPRHRELWLLGLLAAAISLTRLDHILLLVGLGLSVVGFTRRDLPWNARIRRIIPLFLLVGLALTAYYCSNRVFFGHWLPISAAIKTMSRAPVNLLLVLHDKGVAAIVLGNMLVLLWLLWRRANGTDMDSRRELLLGWAFGNTLYAGFLIGFVRWTLGNWYFASSVLLLLVAGGSILERGLSSRWVARRRVLRWVGIAGLLQWLPSLIGNDSIG